MNQTFCVSTNCCAVQRNETYRIAKYLRLNGWSEENDPSLVNMNVITTCGVTDITEKDSFKIIDGILDSKKENGRKREKCKQRGEKVIVVTKKERGMCQTHAPFRHKSCQISIRIRCRQIRRSSRAEE